MLVICKYLIRLEKEGMSITTSLRISILGNTLHAHKNAYIKPDFSIFDIL